MGSLAHGHKLLKQVKSSEIERLAKGLCRMLLPWPETSNCGSCEINCLLCRIRLNEESLESFNGDYPWLEASTLSLEINALPAYYCEFSRYEPLEKLLATALVTKNRMEETFRSHQGSDKCQVCICHGSATWLGMDEGDVVSTVLMEEEFLKYHRPPQITPYSVPEVRRLAKVDLVKKSGDISSALEMYEYEIDERHPLSSGHFFFKPTFKSNVSDYPNSVEYGSELRKMHRYHPKDHGIFIPVSLSPMNEHGRPFEPKFDIELGKSWLKECNHRHTSCRNGEMTSRTPKGIFLVDTDRWSLFQVSDPQTYQASYVAMSYVWGNSNQPQLSSTVLGEWLQPGNLKNVPVPETIKDAIYLTAALGYRYLWVDSLCIVQDQPAMRHQQIAQMHLIYHNAVFTIIAANASSCGEGLHGVSIGESRLIGRGLWNFTNTKIMKIPAEPRYILEASTWRTRGWTFQEELCSRRALIFLPNIVMFSCLERTWREDVHLEDEKTEVSCGRMLSVINVTQRGLPQYEIVSMFRDLVNQYTNRTLTRVDDIENAFAGVGSLIEEHVGPLYHGIPEKYFREIIDGCWYWDHITNRRPPFPSWSWTEWMHTADQADSGITPMSTWKSSPLLNFFGFSEKLQNLSGNAVPACHTHFEPDNNEVTLVYEKVAKLQKAQDLIAFYTSYAVLRVRLAIPSAFGVKTHSVLEYKVLNPATGKHIASIRLKGEFVTEHGSLLPFIVISYSSQAKAYRLMLIEEVSQVFYKVNVTVPGRPVPEHEWWAVQPEKKLIIMG